MLKFGDIQHSIVCLGTEIKDNDNHFKYYTIQERKGQTKLGVCIYELLFSNCWLAADRTLENSWGMLEKAPDL